MPASAQGTSVSVTVIVSQLTSNEHCVTLTFAEQNRISFSINGNNLLSVNLCIFSSEVEIPLSKS